MCLHLSTPGGRFSRNVTGQESLEARGRARCTPSLSRHLSVLIIFLQQLQVLKLKFTVFSPPADTLPADEMVTEAAVFSARIKSLIVHHSSWGCQYEDPAVTADYLEWMSSKVQHEIPHILFLSGHVFPMGLGLVSAQRRIAEL